MGSTRSGYTLLGVALKRFPDGWLDYQSPLNLSGQIGPSPVTTAGPISRQVRPPIWVTHPEGPSGNCSPFIIQCLPVMLKSISLTQTYWSPAHSNFSSEAFKTKQGWSSQLYSLSCQPPWVIPYGVPNYRPELVILLLRPNIVVGLGHVP